MDENLLSLKVIKSMRNENDSITHEHENGHKNEQTGEKQTIQDHLQTVTKKQKRNINLFNNFKNLEEVKMRFL